ncbi:MAG: TraB/GumN family protein [Novosphingobium sp.]|nr:TraB/GumN family protein [Novosphingobium sp.]
MKFRFALSLAAALLAAACSGPREQATPALWEVTGPGGQQAYLFGTIHALSGDVAWRSPPIEDALRNSDRLVLEIAQLDDRAAMREVFARLAETPGQPPLAQKVAPGYRAALARLMRSAGLDERQFAAMETWAAALTLAQAARRGGGDESVDRALMAMARGKPVEELEGTERQLSLFDALPEAEQRDLLDAVVAEAATAGAEDDMLAALWRRGDMKAIARETHRGMLADPELRQALLVERNRNWAEQVSAMLEAGHHPFVAVGASHMAGPEGLPALIEGQGYAVRRVQ